ncbi:DivIVA domain-containing protein [Micromonospora sp. WMMD1082]|uniref:DivIVA domain-containing protein n=1 Tax=Micromonospora sp. WMMD1082 TaxID=3016104 RepID=UPI0024173892|nr:DivIVA domain-containing protein [Micromonospora sp. WMMD1082]MDG4798878.1 DivIVA domain-containing protein [Micromonospora sp. WMMD1082]
MNQGTVYTGRPPRLHPRHVRDRQFATVGFGRRGLDPQQVRQFLHRVAWELASLHQDVARLGDENVRIKRALRDWQSAQAQRRMS